MKCVLPLLGVEMCLTTESFVVVHEKIDILNERLEAAGGDKIVDADVAQGSKASTAIKKCKY